MPTHLIAYFDEDCGVCEHSVTWLRRRATDVEFTGMLAAGRPHDALVVSDGSHEWSAQAAVAVLLRNCSGRHWRLLGSILGWWGVRRIAGVVYRWVAAHRAAISARLGWTVCRVPQ